MENNFPKSSSNIFRIIIGVFLFCYFGIITIPQLLHLFSGQFLLWIFVFPIVIVVLITKGVHGGIGLWREKTKNMPENSENKFWFWLASMSLLWFLISITIAKDTHYVYNHQKFDSQKWISSNWDKESIWGLSSQRERMLDDLIENTLPSRTKTEIIDLLGQPDERRDIEGEETIIYYTGWNIMEPKCLLMRFDKQGIINEYHMTLCG